MKKIRLSWAAGYRSGMAGDIHGINLGKSFLQRCGWDLGWHAGMMEQLKRYLKGKANAK